MENNTELQADKKVGRGFSGHMKSFGSKIKEFCRKKIVQLKRRPSTIPLAFLVVCFVIYTFKLTSISNTTAYIYGDNMGIMSFICVLCSTLAIVSYGGAYPQRGKTKIFMLILSFALVALVLVADILYNNAIVAALTRVKDPIVIGEKTMFIKTAMDMLKTHFIFVCVTAVLMATMPLYAKLIKKINTSVAVDDTAMSTDKTIDIDEK